MINTLKAWYSQMESERAPFLERAQACSKLTIPDVFPPNGRPRGAKSKSGYQSLGAVCINSVVTKSSLTVLPPDHLLARLDVDDATMRKMLEGLDPDTAAEAAIAITEGIARSERTLAKELAASPLRPLFVEGLKQYFIGGNTLVWFKTLKRIRVINLANYVVKRDSDGNLLRVVIKEKVAIRTLAPEIRDACGLQLVEGRDEETEVYTGVELIDGEKYRYWQEINDKEVPGTDAQYPKDLLPFMVLRAIPVDGESYGRSPCDEYFDDLLRYDGLSMSVIQAAAAAARVLYLVRPGRGATTDLRKMERAPNGSFVQGTAEDIQPLQLNKAADMRFAMDTAQAIEQRLKLSFLVVTAIQRSGERVTAEEIRRLANELDASQNSAFSIFSNDFQGPLVRLALAQLAKEKKMPSINGKVLNVTVVTGLDALGRGADAEKLTLFKQDVAGTVAEQAIRPETLASRFAVARGIETDGLVMTPAEMRAKADRERAAQAVQDIATQAAPGMLQAGMGIPSGAPL